MEQQLSNNISNPVEVIVARPERSSRLLAAATLLLMIPKLLVLLPHFIILYFLGIASFAVGIIAQFAVLFTGKYPDGMHKFIVSVYRWQMRVSAFMLGLVDKYPPFEL